MLICNECLEKDFQNGESLFKSNGKYEICEEARLCNEIHSSRLERKIKVRKSSIYGGNVETCPRTGLIIKRE